MSIIKPNQIKFLKSHKYLLFGIVAIMLITISLSVVEIFADKDYKPSSWFNQSDSSSSSTKESKTANNDLENQVNSSAGDVEKVNSSATDISSVNSSTTTTDSQKTNIKKAAIESVYLDKCQISVEYSTMIRYGSEIADQEIKLIDTTMKEKYYLEDYSNFETYLLPKQDYSLTKVSGPDYQFGPGYGLKATCYDGNYTVEEFDKKFSQPPETAYLDNDPGSFFYPTPGVTETKVTPIEKNEFCSKLQIEQNCQEVQNTHLINILLVDGELDIYFFTYKDKTYLVELAQYSGEHLKVNLDSEDKQNTNLETF